MARSHIIPLWAELTMRTGFGDDLKKIQPPMCCQHLVARVLSLNPPIFEASAIQNEIQAGCLKKLIDVYCRSVALIGVSRDDDSSLHHPRSIIPGKKNMRRLINCLLVYFIAFPRYKVYSATAAAESPGLARRSLRSEPSFNSLDDTQQKCNGVS